MCVYISLCTPVQTLRHIVKKKKKLVISRAEKKAIRAVKDTGQPELASPLTLTSVNLAEPHLPSTQPPPPPNPLLLPQVEEGPGG